MRVGVDFDGVIADSAPARQWYLKEKHKLSVSLADIANSIVESTPLLNFRTW